MLNSVPKLNTSEKMCNVGPLWITDESNNHSGGAVCYNIKVFDYCPLSESDIDSDDDFEDYIAMAINNCYCWEWIISVQNQHRFSVWKIGALVKNLHQCIYSSNTCVDEFVETKLAQTCAAPTLLLVVDHLTNTHSEFSFSGTGNCVNCAYNK